MTTQILQNATIGKFIDKEWAPLIAFFWDRYNKRYFDQIECLRNNNNRTIRNNCGFVIATIDCILIETLEQYYSGTDETIGSNHDPFLSFFQRSKKFAGVIKDARDAGKFAGLVRIGLLHQSKTKKASILNKKKSTPILDWIDPTDKPKGFKLNRDKFHEAVYEEFQILIENLKNDKNSDLRRKFKRKLKTLID